MTMPKSVVLEIVAEHGADHLGLVEKTGREQRPDRPVDQARSQCFLLGRTALAFEKAAGNLAGGEGLFLIVDGEREEILSRLRLPVGDRRAQHCGAAIGGHDCAISLARDFTGLQDEAAAAPHDFLAEDLEHLSLSFFQKRVAGAQRWARGPRMGL